MIKISVIVPVYNGEGYLKQCIDSILAQTLTEFELICVDDGSTDSSLELLREYEKKDERVKVLTQKNQYAGAARNHGLAEAAGEYVIFWDSDDYFAKDALKLLYEKAKAEDADICVCDAQDFDSESGTKLAHAYLHKPLPEEDVFCIQSFKERIFLFTAPVTWNKLIRRSLLETEQIRFQELKHINDVAAIYTALACAKRITILKKKLIFYRCNRKESLMGTYGEKSDSIFLAYEKLKEELEKRELLSDEQIRSGFQNKVMAIYLFIMPYCNSYDQFQDYYEQLRQTRLLTMGMGNGQPARMFQEKREESRQAVLNTEAPEFLFWQFQQMTINTNVLKQQLQTVKGNLSKKEKGYQKEQESWKQERELLQKQMQDEKELLELKLREEQQKKQLLQKEKEILEKTVENHKGRQNQWKKRCETAENQCRDLQKKQQEMENEMENQKKYLQLKLVKAAIGLSRMLGKLAFWKKKK